MNKIQIVQLLGSLQHLVGEVKDHRLGQDVVGLVNVPAHMFEGDGIFLPVLSFD